MLLMWLGRHISARAPLASPSAGKSLAWPCGCPPPPPPPLPLRAGAAVPGAPLPASAGKNAASGGASRSRPSSLCARSLPPCAGAQQPPAA